MMESKIQSQIITYLKQEGWLAIKLIQTNTNGIPDLLALRGGTAVFVEVKRPGQQATRLQSYRIEEIKAKGFRACVARSVEDVKAFLKSDSYIKQSK